MAPLCRHIFNVEVGASTCRIFLSQINGAPQEVTSYCVLKTNEFPYHPFCDDFGPMNFLAIVQFIESLDQKIKHGNAEAVVCTASEGRRAFTNAAFLLGAYMLLTLKMTSQAVAERFSAVDSDLFEPYRDATNHTPDFGLTLIDCWSGIQRAMGEQWLARPSSSGSRVWGRINVDEYAHYDDPLNADLHEIIPGKLVAFRTPRSLSGAVYRDARGGVRHFAPTYFLPIFGELGVSDVVQLNPARYDPADFTAAGIAHHNLAFDDCVPPLDNLRRFLAAVAAAPGAVAVHCESGLSRTGTLIAVYMMKHHSFTAREAMGWLRVMRPGSVLGDQQHYLLAVERRLQQQRAAGQPTPPPPPAPDSPAPRPPPGPRWASESPLCQARSALAEALAGADRAAAAAKLPLRD